MNFNEYNLTFDDIYAEFEYEYIQAEQAARGFAVDAVDKRLERYWILCDFFTTLIRHKQTPEYRYAIAHAVNDFREARDGLTAYLTRSKTRRPDKVLEILTETSQVKFADVCSLFGLTADHEHASVLINVLNNINVPDGTGAR
ncbi:MAG: hypothetical protein IJM54_10285 [Thermoguttaceae bacterium]|nr:hypothetical protein [Thermoguttaceae bacterium]